MPRQNSTATWGEGVLLLGDAAGLALALKPRLGRLKATPRRY